jgi:hypothetical protein
MKKVAIFLSIISILFLLGYISVYVIAPKKIRNEIIEYCKDGTTPSGKAHFSCSEVREVFLELDRSSLWGYSICANYLDEEGNQYSIFGYKKVEIIMSKYNSFIPNQRYTCTALSI